MEKALIKPEDLLRRMLELEMPPECLAMRCGLPRQRISEIVMSVCDPISTTEREAIEDALGMTAAGVIKPARQYRDEQARRKANQLTRLVQGTSALEGQGVDVKTFDEMARDTEQKLLSDPHKLWTPL